VNPTAPCAVPATAQVVVTEQAAPLAGTNGTLTICQGTTVTAAQLFAQLGGSPNAGGTWSPALAGAGTYTYTVNPTAPCAVAATAQVVVTEQAIPANPIATVDQQPSCSLPFGVISVTSPLGANLEYSINGTTYQSSPTFSNVAPGTYTITVQVSGLGCTSGSTTATINPIPTPPSTPTVSNDTLYCSGDAYNDLVVSGGSGTFTWYSDQLLSTQIGTGTTLAVIDQLGVTTYYVTETVNDCVSSPASVNISIDPCDTLLPIVVPTAFTPDGDLMNDTWEILYINDVYPDNQVFVYNRWGSLIFESVKGDYDSKPWDGSFNGNALPVGSFYYMIYTNDKDNTILKGIVSIILN
jgi:gliding motility-associated-like protein